MIGENIGNSFAFSKFVARFVLWLRVIIYPLLVEVVGMLKDSDSPKMLNLLLYKNQ